MPTPVVPVASAIAVSNITRSTATITWTTDVPATSQVEFGTSGVGTSRSRVDASLVLDHRQVLTGLDPGGTYRFRVRSVSPGGGLGISPEGVLVTAPAGSGPEIGSASVPRLTGTTATISWVTSTGTVAQVEYGATPNYGSFTLLKVFNSPSQQMLLTDLRPGTDYHFRVNAWDAAGNLNASGDATFTTAVTGLATLVGDQTVQTERITLPAGQAAAYQYVAAQSGQASLVRLYVDAGSSTSVIRVGLYADQDGAPGTILSQASAPGLVAGWINVSLPPVALVKNTRYWVVVLSPVGAGSLSLRDAGLGGSSMLSAQTALAALPQTWTAGQVAARSPLSVYVQQVPPAVTLTGLSDGSIVTGSVPLSAVVDDDAPISLVQFLVDGQPVGGPVDTAPYSTLWDSTRFSARRPHAITARATDLLGRSSTSGVVTVEVDNGPAISALSVGPGLSASSARVTWSTDVLADAQVEYGPTAAYGLSTPANPRLDWRHDMQLTGLAPGAVYHYRVRSRDASGGLAVSPDQTFFTPEP